MYKFLLFTQTFALDQNESICRQQYEYSPTDIIYVFDREREKTNSIL